MYKKVIILVFIAALLCLQCTAFAAAKLIDNPSFENPSGNMPIGWYKGAFNNAPGATDYIYEKGAAHFGDRYITIKNNQQNDARFYQFVSVKPSTVYKLSVWVKAEGCGDNLGATICVLDSTETSKDLKDTNGKWEQIVLYGLTGKYQKLIPIAMRLGGYSSANTGKASFDDVSIEEVGVLPAGATLTSFAGENIDSEQTSEILKKQNEQQKPDLYLFYCFAGLALLLVLIFLLYKTYIKGINEGFTKFVEFLISKAYVIMLSAFLLIVFIFYYLNPNRISTAGVQLAFLVVFLSILIATVYLYLKKRLNPGTLAILIIILGVTLRVCYMLFTDFNTRQHDVHDTWGHLDYIKFIAEKFSLPPVGDYETYHPPVHYLISALVMDAGKLIGFSEFYSLRFVQLAMVLISSLTLIYFYKLLVHIKCSGIVTVIGVSLFAFYPTNVYSSAFVNNDNTFLFFYVLSFYYLFKWLSNKSFKNVVLLALFISLDVLTKKSALQLLPIVGVAFLVEFFKNRSEYKLYIKQALMFLTIAVPLSASFQIRAYLLFHQGLGYFTPAFGIPIPNSMYNLFYVPVEKLFTNPFVDKTGGGTFFSEYLFKSSLFGEWKFPGLEDIAVLLIFAAIAVISVLVIYLLLMKKADLKGYTYIFLLNLIIPIILDIKFRMNLPGHQCSQDFRYIAPILISTAFFTGKAVEKLFKAKYVVLKFLVIGAIYAFCALVSLFVLKIGML